MPNQLNISDVVTIDFACLRTITEEEIQEQCPSGVTISDYRNNDGLFSTQFKASGMIGTLILFVAHVGVYAQKTLITENFKHSI